MPFKISWYQVKINFSLRMRGPPKFELFYLKLDGVEGIFVPPWWHLPIEQSICLALMMAYLPGSDDILGHIV